MAHFLKKPCHFSGVLVPDVLHENDEQDDADDDDCDRRHNVEKRLSAEKLAPDLLRLLHRHDGRRIVQNFIRKSSEKLLNRNYLKENNSFKYILL